MLNQKKHILIHFLKKKKDAVGVSEIVKNLGGDFSVRSIRRWLNELVSEGQVQKASQIKDAYEQSIFLLAHISYLQAFIDVNKRTARLCSNISLIQNNLVPLSFNDIEKDDYIAAMIAIYELNDIHPLLDLSILSYLRSCQTYTATVEALGFDPIRIHYRAQRREVLRNVIVRQMIGKNLNEYVVSEAEEKVELQDRQRFIEDVFEDLKEIGPERIAGLGITVDELIAWKEKFKN